MKVHYESLPKMSETEEQKQAIDDICMNQFTKKGIREKPPSEF